MKLNRENIFSIACSADFKDLALQLFKHQATHCPIYKQYVQYLGIDLHEVQQLEEIPFLPIDFFKTQSVIEAGMKTVQVFSSSGTGGGPSSKHLVADLSMYEASYRKAFDLFYGPIAEMNILALLPAYQERTGSSLIYMVDDLISQSHQSDSGYFLYNHEELYHTLLKLKAQGKPTLLLGVTYALLDFVESFSVDFPELMVMETGGMKGRRKEMVREELHQRLCAGFGVAQIHSEYGMTELLSQAYSFGKGVFNCPPWMKICIRDTNDPLTLIGNEKTGGINVIDLANMHSCAFIATQDLGRSYEDGSFEVLGRFDHSDIRGCNLLIQ